ncbi:hypothetical protein D9M70_522550 [compost metagenome]
MVHTRQGQLGHATSLVRNGGSLRIAVAIELDENPSRLCTVTGQGLADGRLVELRRGHAFALAVDELGLTGAIGAALFADVGGWSLTHAIRKVEVSARRTGIALASTRHVVRLRGSRIDVVPALEANAAGVHLNAVVVPTVFRTPLQVQPAPARRLRRSSIKALAGRKDEPRVVSRKSVRGTKQQTKSQQALHYHPLRIRKAEAAPRTKKVYS